MPLIPEKSQRSSYRRPPDPCTCAAGVDPTCPSDLIPRPSPQLQRSIWPQHERASQQTVPASPHWRRSRPGGTLGRWWRPSRPRQQGCAWLHAGPRGAGPSRPVCASTGGRAFCGRSSAFCHCKRQEKMSGVSRNWLSDKRCNLVKFCGH